MYLTNIGNYNFQFTIKNVLRFNCFIYCKLIRTILPFEIFATLTFRPAPNKAPMNINGRFYSPLAKVVLETPPATKMKKEYNFRNDFSAKSFPPTAAKQISRESDDNLISTSKPHRSRLSRVKPRRTLRSDRKSRDYSAKRRNAADSLTAQ